ncbi:hypothetical protein QNI19_26920 [Cytophagaceae bacterium DM2B3-1]|uniref:Uncharacterized protein n=2 Tax=Xanthocytophaga TaxID=3078918 RepID=A0AAE3QXX6_9BACT|nr:MULTISPECIES: hypothetical protein [Xanthocytophaga]MDJ1471556.1 hypothetical protein [Xanthocytophaga flavus]MDJ1485215.1 hypothetical protein [Xanthocytophaga flavus]MDJ1496594.1 hypothetical protein [Xanthocytophaga flavus]MDJ1504931.1 hypothetical protein [Xanthocytophaga agilis]
MKRILFGLVFLLGVVLTQEAFSQTYVSVRIGTPPPRRVVYARPVPPPPVVYAPAPVYVAPRPAVIVRPRPVVVVPARPVYVYPRHRHGYHRW